MTETVEMASFLWLPVSLLVWIALGTFTWIASRRGLENTGEYPNSSFVDSVSALSRIALALSAVLTVGGMATVLAIELLAESGPDPLLPVALLDIATVLLLGAYVRILVLVRGGARVPSRILAWAYVVTFVGAILVLTSIAFVGLPHVEGGIVGLLT